MKQKHFARKVRQLNSNLQKLQLLKDVGATRKQLNILAGKIKKLLVGLSAVFSPLYLKRIMASVAVLAGVAMTSPAQAQSFASPVSDPFGISFTGYYAFPAFMDLDNDGDLDLMMGDDSGNMFYYENTGDKNSPQFAAGQSGAFGLTQLPDPALAKAADMDGDGDLDILMGVRKDPDADFWYYENTGTPTAPQFEPPVTNPFGLTPAVLIPINDIVDIDSDGDYDIIAGEMYGSFRFYENTGSATNPQFAAAQVNPFGLSSTYLLAIPTFADFDLDGDMDLMAGEYYANLQYFENTGSAASPQFAAPQSNPFGLGGFSYSPIPAAADLDGDGDVDLLVCDYNGIKYFENTELTLDVQINRDENISMNLYPNPVSSTLHLETNEIPEKIELFDHTGRLVKSPLPESETIDVSQLPPGHYFLKLTCESKLLIQKFVVQ